MIKAQIDMPQLLRSLKASSKAFGEDSAQATIRWGVATARELAKATQAWGDNAKSEAKQRGAIIKDALNVVKISGSGKPRRGTLTNPADVVAWINQHRDGRRKRTRKLEIGEKKTVTRDALAGAIAAKMKLAGIAKGGWIGAGNEMASKQTGGGKFAIGKSYIRYAQKHSNFGKAKAARPGFRQVSELQNRSKHSSSFAVLSNARTNSSIAWGLRKTIKWYDKAATANQKKIKP